MFNLYKLEIVLAKYSDDKRYKDILVSETNAKTRNILRFYKEYYLDSELQKEFEISANVSLENSLENPSVGNLKACLTRIMNKPLEFNLGEIKEIWQLLDLLYEHLRKGDLTEEFVLQSQAFIVFAESLEQDIHAIDHIPNFLYCDSLFREHCIHVLLKRENLLKNLESSQRKELLSDILMKCPNEEQ